MGAQLGRRQVGPPTLSRFCGREAELRQLRSLLESDRLVTITGAGGVGKTRLALELARGVSDAFLDGVWVVELARLEDPELLAPAVAQSVGAPEDRGIDHLDRAANVLAAGRQLIVLDNCEHLLTAAAGAVHHLLSRCPELRVLATSRAPLGVEGEQAWPAPPLGLPRPGVLEVSAVGEAEAIQLFCDRARHAIPAFQLTAGNVEDVSNICRGLDGLPLALELAAGWVPVLSLKQVSSRLDDSLALLASGRADRLPRHRTIRATLDWSHQLLTPAERTAFARLSVFVGGFTIEAAEAVLAGLALDHPPLELVASLAARSLVGADVSGDEARYRMLEPVRQYAAEKLRATPDDENEARSRHLGFLADLAEQAEWPIFGGPDLPWLRRLDQELPNVRTALTWGFEGEYEQAARLASALLWFCYVRSLYDEGCDWARKAMRSTGRSRVRAALMAGALLSHTAGETEAAERYLAEAHQLIIEGEWWPDLVNVLAFQAGLATIRGDTSTARRCAEQALDLARRLGDDSLLIRPLNRLGILADLEDDHERARDLFREAIAVADRRGAVWAAAVQRGNLVCIAVDMGDHETVRQALPDLFRIFAEIGATPAIVADSVRNAGILATQQGQGARGLRLLAAAQATFDRTRYHDNPDDATRQRRWVETAREQADEEADAAWHQGLELTLDDAIAEAQTLLVEPTVPAVTSASSPRTSSSPAALAEVVEGGTFLREGEFWSVTYGGVVVRLRDSKGLRDIARLLSSPGREAAAVDLAAGVFQTHTGGTATVAELGLGLERDAGEALDAEARTQYRVRLGELEEELADAEAANDPERASRARQEREFLLAELGAAVGLSGRPRRALDPAERARKAVTGRIRDALNHIEAVHPGLGRHLRRSVRTGSFCAYDPPEATRWRLR